MIRTLSESEPTTLSSIDRAYRGDLDTIVGKAMERDKSRRYPSAGELAADVRRHLDDQPIHARPPSTLYHMRKFARRNKALVGGVAAVFIALVGGMITTSWQWRQAIAARDEQVELRKEADDNAARASAEARKAEAVNAFLTRMLASANPEVTQGRDVLVAEVLDAAAQELDEGALDSQPDVQAQVHMTIGGTYQSIGRVEHAQRHYERALALARRDGQSRPEEEAAALTAIGVVHNIRGDRQQARVLTEQALGILIGAHGQQDREDIASCLLNLAGYAADEGQTADAIELHQRGLEMVQRLRGEDDAYVAQQQARLAGMLHNPAQAEPLVRAALRTFEAVGETHPSHVQALRTLADIISMRGGYDEAQAMYRRALELGTKVYGRDHHRNLMTLGNLGFCLRLARKPEAYADVCDEIMAMSIRLYGERSMRVAEALLDRADVLTALGRDDQGEADFRLAREIADERAGPGDPRACVARLGVALAIVERGGDLDEVESLASEVLAFQQQFRGEQRWLAGQALCLLGEAALRRGSLLEAERMLLEGYQRLGASALVRGKRARAAEQLVQIYQALHAADPHAGHDVQAEKWRALHAELMSPASAATQPVAAR
jgi:tetratricopeptide (TPR) repeat protein